jgi:hypothetical protein
MRDQRVTAIMDTRMAMNESKNRDPFGQNGEQTDPTMLPTKLKHPLRKKLEAWQTDTILSEQVVTLLNRSQPQNETTDNTERILPASVDQNPHRPAAPTRGQTQTSLGTITARRRFRQQRGP